MMTHSAHGAGAAVTLVVVFALAVVAAAYLGAAMRQRHAQRRWSVLRSASFVAGIGIVAAALSPWLMQWAHAELRGHMTQHLLLGMVAPLALTLGAPVTLLLRSLPVSAARRISALLRSPIARRITHPVTALLLDVGGLYLLYLTPLYALARTEPLLYGVIHFHFFAAGYLFAAAVVGPDPMPHRPRRGVRLGVLFAAIAAHSTLAKVLYAHGYPRGATHDLEEIRAAAQLMYYGGDIVELVLVIILFATWYRAAGRRLRSVAAAHTPSQVHTDQGVWLTGRARWTE